jgi:outer membrane protein assembly factor BamB
MKDFGSSLPLKTGVAVLSLWTAAMLCETAIAAPAMSLSSLAGPPTTTVTVSGTGFSASAQVDIYFDTTDLCLAVASGAGAISCAIKVPKDAQPQTHYISAIQRNTGTGAQKSFIVRTDWAQFHGRDAKHTGFNPYENTINPSNVRNLDILWQASIGQTRGTPAVWGSRVYIGGDDGKLYAFWAKNGATVAGFPKTLGGPVLYSSPAVGSNIVYIGTASPDNKLYAFNASNGAAIAGFPVNLSGYNNSAPTVYGGKVYVACNDGNIYAFDAATGAAVPGFPFIVGGGGAAFLPSISAANGRIYEGLSDGPFYAFDADTGAIIAGYPKTTNGSVVGSAAIVSGQIFLTAGDGRLYGFHRNGSNLSGFPAASGGPQVWSSPAVGDGQAIIGHTNHGIYSFDPGSGALRWNTLLDDAVYSSPVIANGLVYVNSSVSLVALNEDNGQALWRASVRTSYPASPAVSDGIVFIGSIDGLLYAFSANGVAPSSRLAGGELGIKPALSSLKPNYSLRAGGKASG